jgi:hypothetical protein
MSIRQAAFKAVVENGQALVIDAGTIGKFDVPERKQGLWVAGIGDDLNLTADSGQVGFDSMLDGDD